MSDDGASEETDESKGLEGVVDQESEEERAGAKRVGKTGKTKRAPASKALKASQKPQSNLLGRELVRLSRPTSGCIESIMGFQSPKLWPT